MAVSIVWYDSVPASCGIQEFNAKPSKGKLCIALYLPGSFFSVKHKGDSTKVVKFGFGKEPIIRLALSYFTRSCFIAIGFNKADWLLFLNGLLLPFWAFPTSITILSNLNLRPYLNPSTKKSDITLS